MKFLYLLFAVLLLIFQATSGSADPLYPDTVECKRQGNFCRPGVCPPTFTASGSCHGGLMNCCSRIVPE